MAACLWPVSLVIGVFEWWLASQSPSYNILAMIILGKDISNFVDLASSTLGEDDLAAQKTRYLLNALTGYAPLIYYDFENTKTDFERFLELCNAVWTTLEENPELADNLVSKSRFAPFIVCCGVCCAFALYLTVLVSIM